MKKAKVMLDRIYDQASDTSHACHHEQLVILDGDAGAIQCEPCGKRWCPTLKVSPKSKRIAARARRESRL